MALFFFIPFDLIASAAAHGLASKVLGDAYVLLHPTSISGMIGLLLIAASRHQGQSAEAASFRHFAVVSLLFCVAGAMALVSSVLNESNLVLALRQLHLGYMAPGLALLALLVLPTTYRHMAWRSFYLGWIALLLISIPLLQDSWQRALSLSSVFAEAPFGVKLYMWRYMSLEESSSYHQIIGNANKTSNYLLIFLLLAVVLLRPRARIDVSRAILFGYIVLATTTLFILFSRAALLLLPVVILASGMLRVIPRSAMWLVGVLIALVVTYYFADASVILRRVILGESTVGGNEDILLGTMVDRFEQWRDVVRIIGESIGTPYLGLGVGEYGRIVFGSVDRGTHNMFLDTFIEAGIVGLGALFATFLMAAFLNLRQTGLSRRVGWVGILVLVLLMFREHSPSYLYATSLGGFSILATFLAICSPKGHCEGEHYRQRAT